MAGGKGTVNQQNADPVYNIEHLFVHPDTRAPVLDPHLHHMATAHETCPSHLANPPPTAELPNHGRDQPSGVRLGVHVAEVIEKGGPMDHFAIYLVLQAPFSLGRGWLYLRVQDTLRRTIP